MSQKKPHQHRKKAVSYLRVSTTKQVKREFNPEGISIPAQRRANKQKADSLGADIVEEFIDKGRSAKTIDQRKDFQDMIDYIREAGDIDYVILDSLSRSNRNRIEDALMLMKIRQTGTSVVSATEAIDDTPPGQLLHGVLAAVNEFRSAADGNEVRRKMQYKASIGGTPGRAPIGYLNVRENYEGRMVSTVLIDEKRGPLVKLAFELYGTGTYTLDSLADAMAEAGLCSLPHGERPVTTISRGHLGRMLRDRYYIGYVMFKGVEYEGRHPHLITIDLFHRVQEIMDAQSGSGIRQRKHNHYLRGILWCHRCGRRMVVSVAKGTYEYYMCRGRQEHMCDLPYIPVGKIEQEVIDHYATITLPAEFQAAVRAEFDKELNSTIDTDARRREQLNQRLKELSEKEDHYLDLIDNPDWPKEKLTERMQDIRVDREKILIQLDQLDADLEVGRNIFLSALALLNKPQRLYRTSTHAQRKMLNNLIFTKLKIDTTGVADDELAEPFEALIPTARRYTHRSTVDTPDTDSQTLTPEMILAVTSSSKTTWVPPAGFEPAA